MNNPLHSPIDQDTAQAERAAKIRFKQQVFASVGGGMIFALVGVVTTALLTMSGGFLASALGIGSVAALGLGCVYFAAKYLSRAVSMDQQTQAEKISAATRGKSPVITPAVENTKPMNAPYGMGVVASDEKSADADKAKSETPTTTLSDISYHNKIAASHGEKITLH